MKPFRDEHAALRARIEALEGELRSRGPDSEAQARQLEQLRARVSEAIARLETDRAELADLHGWLDGLRDIRREARARAWRRRRAWLVASAGFASLALAVGIAVAVQRSAPAEDPSSPPARTAKAFASRARLHPIALETFARHLLPEEGSGWLLAELSIQGLDGAGMFDLRRPGVTAEYTFHRHGRVQMVQVANGTARAVAVPNWSFGRRTDRHWLVGVDIAEVVRHLAPYTTSHRVRWSGRVESRIEIDGEPHEIPR